MPGLPVTGVVVNGELCVGVGGEPFYVKLWVRIAWFIVVFVTRTMNI